MNVSTRRRLTQFLSGDATDTMIIHDGKGKPYHSDTGTPCANEENCPKAGGTERADSEVSSNGSDKAPSKSRKLSLNASSAAHRMKRLLMTPDELDRLRTYERAVRKAKAAEAAGEEVPEEVRRIIAERKAASASRDPRTLSVSRLRVKKRLEGASEEELELRRRINSLQARRSQWKMVPSKVEEITKEFEDLRGRLRDLVNGPGDGRGDRPTRSAMISSPRVRRLAAEISRCRNSILELTHAVGNGRIDPDSGRARIAAVQKRLDVLKGRLAERRKLDHEKLVEDAANGVNRQIEYWVKGDGRYWKVTEQFVGTRWRVVSDERPQELQEDARRRSRESARASRDRARQLKAAVRKLLNGPESPGFGEKYDALMRDASSYGLTGYELRDYQRRYMARYHRDTIDREGFERYMAERGHPRISEGPAQDAAVSYLEMVADDGRREMLQDLDRLVDTLIECDWLLQACGLESVFATPEDVDGQDDPED